MERDFSLLYKPIFGSLVCYKCIVNIMHVELFNMKHKYKVSIYLVQLPRYDCTLLSYLY